MFIPKYWKLITTMAICCLCINLKLKTMQVNARSVPAESKRSAYTKGPPPNLEEFEQRMRQNFYNGFLKVKGKILQRPRTFLPKKDDSCSADAGSTESTAAACDITTPTTITTIAMPTTEECAEPETTTTNEECPSDMSTSTTIASSMECNDNSKSTYSLSSGIISFNFHFEPNNGKGHKNDAQSCPANTTNKINDLKVHKPKREIEKLKTPVQRTVQYPEFQRRFNAQKYRRLKKQFHGPYKYPNQLILQQV